MDAVQATLLGIGIIVCLIPLEWVQDMFLDQGTQLSVWTLLVPLMGAGMVAVALASYHKNSLQIISRNMLNTLDQIGGYILPK